MSNLISKSIDVNITALVMLEAIEISQYARKIVVKVLTNFHSMSILDWEKCSNY
jgi:hypothetical protein